MGVVSGEAKVRDLTICPGCGRDFVRPVDWHEADTVNWRVVLRCGNCDRGEEGVFDQATVDVFDDRLDVLTDILVRDLRIAVRLNLSLEADRFAAALAVDAILPEDF